MVASCVKPIRVQVGAVLLKDLDNCMLEAMLHILVKFCDSVSISVKFLSSNDLGHNNLCKKDEELIDLHKDHKRRKIRFFSETKGLQNRFIIDD